MNGPVGWANSAKSDRRGTGFTLRRLFNPK